MYKKILLVIWWLLTLAIVIVAGMQILDHGSILHLKIMIYLLICMGVCILLYIWEG